MPNGYAIDVQDIRKTYRDGWIFRRPFHALNGVSLQVGYGEVFGLLGPNGAGKTTLVKLLLGIVRKTGGRAEMLGLPAGDRAGRRQIGYLPENLRIPRHHTANSALELYGQMSGLPRSEVRRRRGPLLESVELASRAGDSVKKYSKGMLQRLGLAIALLHEPQLVFLDEPTDGLDPTGRAEVRETLVRLKEAGKTIFLNSHMLQEVEQVCDRVAILDHGLLKGIGTVEELVPRRSEEIDVRLTVSGPWSAVNAVLKRYPNAIIASDEGQHHQIQVSLADQGAIDRVVDELRQQALSITALGRRRVTLEEAFLEVTGMKKRETP
jgi:ABC-2 type transport system ATP-binding protein